MFLSPINQSINPLRLAMREILKDLKITDKMIDENAKLGHDPKSLPVLVRALDNA